MRGGGEEGSSLGGKENFSNVATLNYKDLDQEMKRLGKLNEQD